MDREIPIQVRKKERNKRIIRISAVLIIIVIAFGLLFNFLKSSIPSDKLLIAEVSNGDIVITINGSGKVVPLNEEIIVAPINSRILEVYKNIGDSLDAGEPILKLELASIETEYNQKMDEYEMLKNKLKQAQVTTKNQISELELQEKVSEMKLKQMRTELINERYLDSIGASTADKVRQIALNYEVSKLELEQLKQKIKNEQTKADVEQDIQKLEISIFQKGLEESMRLLKDSRILSPQKATLTYVNNQIGAQVNVGSQIAIVSDLNHFKIEAEMASSYAERLKAGAKAIVKIGQVNITGTVVNITPSVKNGIISFAIIPEKTADKQLRSGLSADVYVEYGVKDNVKRIPNFAGYKGPGTYDLWVVTANKATKHQVSLGDSSYEYIEVKDGLETGDKVILSSTADFDNKQTITIN